MANAGLEVGHWCSREPRAEGVVAETLCRNEVWFLGIDYCKLRLIYT